MSILDRKNLLEYYLSNMSILDRRRNLLEYYPSNMSILDRYFSRFLLSDIDMFDRLYSSRFLLSNIDMFDR
jgi:hypothetical protein